MNDQRYADMDASVAFCKLHARLRMNVDATLISVLTDAFKRS